MTRLSLGSNIASLQAQRRLGESTSALNKVYEQLSSGLRILHASDDAAGLSIADSLNAKARVFTRGIQNLNDGISYLNIADSALGELSTITTRILELTEQAANGTYSSKQRAAQDAEAQALQQEFLRITKTTSFNGINILDGSSQGIRLQNGMGIDGSLFSTLGGSQGTGTFQAATTNALPPGSPYYITTADINGDGNLDIVTANAFASQLAVSYGNGNGTFSVATTINVNAGFVTTANFADVNQDGVLDLITTDYSTSQISVFIGVGNGTFGAPTTMKTSGTNPFGLSIGDINGDGIMDIATADEGSASTSIFLGKGDGTFSSARSFALGSASPNSVVLADVNHDGKLDLVSANYTGGGNSVALGNGDGSFQTAIVYATGGAQPVAVTVADMNGDGNLDIISTSTNAVAILFGKGDGTFQSGVTYATGSNNAYSVSVGDLNGDGILDVVASNYGSGNVSVFFGNGDGTLKTVTNYSSGGNSPRSSTLGDFNNDGALDILVANQNSSSFGVLLNSTRDGVNPILPFSLLNQASARQALSPLSRKLDQINGQRGVIGAFQSRVMTAISAQTAQTDLIKAAESRIRDVDVAQQSAELVRLQILQQSAAAVLAQANMQPEILLKLLKT